MTSPARDRCRWKRPSHAMKPRLVGNDTALYRNSSAQSAHHPLWHGRDPVRLGRNRRLPHRAFAGRLGARSRRTVITTYGRDFATASRCSIATARRGKSGGRCRPGCVSRMAGMSSRPCQPDRRMTRAAPRLLLTLLLLAAVPRRSRAIRRRCGTSCTDRCVPDATGNRSPRLALSGCRAGLRGAERP